MVVSVRGQCFPETVLEERHISTRWPGVVSVFQKVMVSRKPEWVVPKSTPQRCSVLEWVFSSTSRLESGFWGSYSEKVSLELSGNATRMWLKLDCRLLQMGFYTFSANTCQSQIIMCFECLGGVGETNGQLFWGMLGPHSSSPVNCWTYLDIILVNPCVVLGSFWPKSQLCHCISQVCSWCF